MERQYIQHLRDLPIEEVAARLGMEVSRHKALCPFHDDHHASLSFNPRKNSYRCFACDAHGDSIDLAKHLLHLDFLDACHWLASHFSIHIDSPLSSPLSTPKATPPSFDPSRYQRFFINPTLSQPASHFLFSQRLLDPRVIKWCRLSSWLSRNNTPFLQIPYFDTSGHLIGIQNRNLDPNPNPRFLFPQGSQCHLYNLPILSRLRDGDHLFFTEGPSDCWSMLSAGYKAIAIPSATLFRPSHLDAIKPILSSLHISLHMFPDNDAPGFQLYLQLKDALPSLQLHQLPPSCKDFSDFYLSSKQKKGTAS